MRKIFILFFFFLFFFGNFQFAYGASASFVLSPSTGQYKVGETFSTAVILDTDGGKTSGADIYFNYNKAILELTDIRNGTIYDQYVGKTIDQALGKGSLSGLVRSRDVLFSGRGTFATLVFRGKAEGVGRVTFRFTPGDENDSNVADYEKQGEILSFVTNGTYTISGVYTGPTSASGEPLGAPEVVFTPTLEPFPSNFPEEGKKKEIPWYFFLLGGIFMIVVLGLLFRKFYLKRRVI